MNTNYTTRPKALCVYNQDNECFLSLGATLGETRLARFCRWTGLARYRADGGFWIRPQDVRPAFGFGALRDLVYIDSHHRVVHVIESFPAYRTAPVRPCASSLLAFPPRTVSASQTRPGHQLLICAPGEMEQRLLEMREEAGFREQQLKIYTGSAPPALYAEPFSAGIACFLQGDSLPEHPIRDLNPRGLFLVTRDRWPIGAEVSMSLQPSGSLQKQPVTLRMRVTQWTPDGVGLEFAGAAGDLGEFTSRQVS